jgi:hypothetical protein
MAGIVMLMLVIMTVMLAVGVGVVITMTVMIGARGDSRGRASTPLALRWRGYG